MKSVAFSKAAACIVGIICSLAPGTSTAQSCKCPRNPGPGGGVQCSKDQIATCDPSSGECNCTCDSVQPGKTKADYEAQIFSKVLHTKVDPSDLSTGQYSVPVSSFRKSLEGKDTFSFDKEEGPAGRQERKGQIKVGVPEWLEEVLNNKGGVSLGPGASLQNCPNGICIGGENSGTATVNNYAPPTRLLDSGHREKFKAALRGTPKDVVYIFPDGTDTDVIPLAKQLCDLFNDSWTADCPPGISPLTLPTDLVGIHCYSAKNAAMQAFHEGGLDCIVEDRPFIAGGTTIYTMTILIGNAKR